jgi:phenylacetate-CoA ligase
MAFLHHIWSRIGYRLGDGRAILRDYGRNVPTGRRKWRFDPALKELWLSPFDLREETVEEYLSLLHKYKVRWLYGVPSAISMLAGYARRKGWQPPASFRGVLPASETLFESQRTLIAESFGGTPVLPFYGLSERVAIAGEVPGRPQVYAFEPLYGVTELVDDGGGPIREPGQRGRIVATGFISEAMPFIRYDTGDYGELVEQACADNGYMMLVRGVDSRWSQEYVFGRSGEPISVVSLDQENYADVVREYQYLQDSLGKVVFRAVPCAGVSAAALEAVLEPARRKVVGVMEISVEIVDRLKVGATGKRSFVDQRIQSGLIEAITGALPQIPAEMPAAASAEQVETI